MDQDLVHVRYMVDDVDAAVAFYTAHFGFTQLSSAAPAFADVVRGKLRLLVSGRTTPPADRCRTAASLAPAGGIASTCWWTTSRPMWTGCARPA